MTEQASSTPSRRPAWLPLALGGLVALVALGGAGAAALVVLDDSGSPSRLTAAHDECVDGAGTIEIGDEGSSLLIDTGEDGGFTELGGVLLELETSEATIRALDSTTAMMGVQTTEQDGLAYRWSYHPDNGLNMTITELDGYTRD